MNQGNNPYDSPRAVSESCENMSSYPSRLTMWLFLLIIFGTYCGDTQISYGIGKTEPGIFSSLISSVILIIALNALSATISLPFMLKSKQRFIEVYSRVAFWLYLVSISIMVSLLGVAAFELVMNII